MSAYSGHFSGEQPGISSSAALAVKGNQLGGKILLNGKQGIVSGTIQGAEASGHIDDQETGLQYAFTSLMQNDALHVSIVFPELGNMAIDLVMQRSPEEIPAANETSLNAGSQDARLVGTWRYTEVLGGGYGDNYGSMATDYFMRLHENGMAESWTGQSAGGAWDSVFSASGEKEAITQRWHTSGKTLVFSDTVSGQQQAVIFYADGNRIMLDDGSSQKKIFERVG